VHAEQVGLFGKVPANSLGIVPSDHYGLVADLTFVDVSPRSGRVGSAKRAK
jgi:hypothetical protein